jgi:hypothetical protein
MPKKHLISILPAVVFLLLVTSTASSASGLKGKFALGWAGGFAIPMGDFAKGEFPYEDGGAATSGLGFTTQLEYYISNNIAIGGNLSYPTFGTQTESFEYMWSSILSMQGVGLFKIDIDLKQKMVSFGAFGKYLFSPSSQNRPYLKLGAGMGKYSLSGDATVKLITMGGVLDKDFDASFGSRFYINLGTGLQHSVTNHIALVVDVSYFYMFTKDAEGKFKTNEGSRIIEHDIYLDFNSQYFSVYAGLSFFFGGQN